MAIDYKRVPVLITEDPVFSSVCQTLDQFKPNNLWTNVSGICQVMMCQHGKYHVHVMGMAGYVVFEHPDHAAIYITGLTRGRRIQ